MVEPRTSTLPRGSEQPPKAPEYTLPRTPNRGLQTSIFLLRRSSVIRSDIHIDLRAGSHTWDVVFGVVWALGLEPGRRPPGLDAAIDAVAERRKLALTEPEDAVRRAARDMLRHGKYKPTGRGKPASEYLLRAARQDTFPRISAPVDICNLISLEYLVPASVWDLDLGSGPYTARRGRADESYVFNVTGQQIGLEDLLVVCGQGDAPMVNPVKDSQATKTRSETLNVGGVVYLPASQDLDAQAICGRFVELLEGCGVEKRAGFQVVPGAP